MNLSLITSLQIRGGMFWEQAVWIEWGYFSPDIEGYSLGLENLAGMAGDSRLFNRMEQTLL